MGFDVQCIFMAVALFNSRLTVYSETRGSAIVLFSFADCMPEWQQTKGPAVLLALLKILIMFFSKLQLRNLEI